MRRPTLSLEDAATILDAFARGETLPKPKVVWRGDGDDFDLERVEDLRDELSDLRREVGEKSDARFWARFEGMAAGIVHRCLGLTTTTAADPEFWAWLVLGREDEYFIALTDWRHGAPGPGKGNVLNYCTSGDLEKGLMSRLWLRGDLAHDPDADGDPYELAQRGDQDLWRSHILRQEYGQVRTVARALLRFQYPDDDPERRTVSNKVLREMAKELRKRHASFAFELMTPEDASLLIDDVHGSVGPG